MGPKRQQLEEPAASTRSSRRGSLPTADFDVVMKKKQSKSKDQKIKNVKEEEQDKKKVSKRIASRSREEIEEVLGRGRRNASGKRMDEEKKKEGKKVKEEVEVVSGRQGSKKIREVEEEQQKGKRRQSVKEEPVVVEKKSGKNQKDQESKSHKKEEKNESLVVKKNRKSSGISIDTTPAKGEKTEKKKDKKILKEIEVKQEEEEEIKVKSKGSKKAVIEEIANKETTKDSRRSKKRNIEEEEEQEKAQIIIKKQDKSVEIKQKTAKRKVSQDNIAEPKQTNKDKKKESKLADKGQSNSSSQVAEKQKETKLPQTTTKSDNLPKEPLPAKPKRKIEIVISNEAENELSTKPQKKRKEFVASEQREFKEVIFLNPEMIKKQEQAFEEALKNQKLEILGKIAVQKQKQQQKKTKGQGKVKEQVKDDDEEKEKEEEEQEENNENSMVIDISVNGKDDEEEEEEDKDQDQDQEVDEEKEDLSSKKNKKSSAVVPFKKGLDLNMFFVKKRKDCKNNNNTDSNSSNNNTQQAESQRDSIQVNDQVIQEKPKRGRKKKIISNNEEIQTDRRMQSKNDKQTKYIENAQPDSSEDEGVAADNNDNNNNNDDETKANTQQQQLTVNSKSKYFRINSKGRVKKQSKNKGQLDENGLMSKLNIEAVRTDFDEAIETLQEYSLPSEIPCRESEKKEILDFLTEGLDNNGSSNCLYISGVPGIGKTASFLEVVTKLQKDREDEFQFISVNAMKLSNPESLYNVLTKEIAQINPSSKNQACLILNELFTRGKLPKKYQDKYEGQLKKQNIIILLDELDYLVTSDQEVLYNLMEWPHHRESRLTIVGIANTMNLPEQLMQKIKSRMGSRRLVFNQYSHKQIQTIVRARLETVQTVFEPTAVDFACRKIAISSSDIRKTLKVLRKSVEICQKESTNLVKIQHIQEAYTLLYSSPSLNAIKKLGFHHKLLILSLALENKHRGLPIAYLSESFERYRVMANNLGSAQILGSSAINLVLSQLCSFGLFSVKEKTHCTKEGQQSIDPNKKKHTNVLDALVTSNFTVDDITNSLREDEIYLKFQFQF